MKDRLKDLKKSIAMPNEAKNVFMADFFKEIETLRADISAIRY